MNTNRKSDITPEMIAKAKEYPFEDLYPFKRGYAKCFNHADSTPSMQLYKDTNRAYCFSCQKSFDPIDFVRITEGLSFKDAVRRLQG